MDFHKGLINLLCGCRIQPQFTCLCHKFSVVFFFFFTRNFSSFKWLQLMNGQGLFPPAYLNQIMGLSWKTAFCSSSLVVRLKMWDHDYQQPRPKGITFSCEKGLLCCRVGGSCHEHWNAAVGLEPLKRLRMSFSNLLFHYALLSLLNCTY